MKILESWLREWVNPDLSSADLAHQLTMLGLEVDEVGGQGLTDGPLLQLDVGELLGEETIHAAPPQVAPAGPTPLDVQFELSGYLRGGAG